jgi:mutator protein MutT
LRTIDDFSVCDSFYLDKEVEVSKEKEYQAKKRQQATPAVHLILKKRFGDFLICERQGTGYLDGHWDLPSGHLEVGETPAEAMARECKEEIGVEVHPSDLQLVHTSFRPVHDKTGNRIDFVFMTKNWKGEVRIGEPKKCKTLKWAKYEKLPLKMVPQVKVFIHAWTIGKRYTELDLDWLKDKGLYKL